MGKKQGKNRNSSLSPYPLSSKGSNKTKNISQHRRETNCEPVLEEKDLSHSSANQLSSNPFQFVKTRGEDSSASQVLRRPIIHTSITNTNLEQQYCYYQTNQSRWMKQNQYKVHNINCWLDNVLENNQNNLEQNYEDYELIHESSGTDSDEESDEESDCLEVDSASCSFRNQQYQTYGAGVKRELLNVDGNETSYRQDKIRTLKALIARHDERLNEINRFQPDMETNEEDGHVETSYRQDKLKTLKALIAAKRDEQYFDGANRFQHLETNEKNQKNLCKTPDRVKNCQLHQNVKAKTSIKPIKEKKTSFDIRKPNSIFLAVLNEELIKNEQNTPKLAHFTRRRKVKDRTEHSWGCCGSETLSERKEDFSLSHMEFEHISA